MNWTEGRWRAFITSVLRGGFRKYPAKFETLKEAKVGKLLNEKSGRMAEHYRCASCNQDFPMKDVQVDHIKPVVDPKRGFKTWDEYIDRLYCDSDNLQVLCIPCHKAKTAKEGKKRK